MARMRALQGIDPEAEGEDQAPVIQPEIARVLLNQRVIRELNRAMPSFNRAGLLADIFSEWGRRKGKEGQAALAQALVEEFEACKPGSIPRQRILDTVCRLVNWHSDDVQTRPVEEMTEEELVSAITASLPRLSQHVSEEVCNEPI